MGLLVLILAVFEAMDFVYESMMKEENMSRMFTLLRMGIPVEALVKVITFSGFLEGRWTVDTTKLLEPIVAMMIAGEAGLAEIPAKVNLGDASDSEFFKDMAERKLDMNQKEIDKTIFYEKQQFRQVWIWIMLIIMLLTPKLEMIIL